MTFSLNNRLILEPYIKTGLKSEIKNGIAIPGQKDAIKGLKVLISAYLPDGRHIPKGSTAYIREEALHTQTWASRPFSCDTMPGKFMIVGLEFIEFIDVPEDENTA